MIEFIEKYGLTISMVLIASYFGTQIKSGFSLEEDTSKADYDIIKKYILNDSPLYGLNRPKLWIHSKYEVNSRNWYSFGSRNSTDLNQPYLSYTVKTIIDNCGDDFHICLIDDESFNKLIPGFELELKKIPEPLREQYREIALLQLIHLYGGLLVPNSFISTKSLKDVYDNLTKKENILVFEKQNKSCDVRQGTKKQFVPNIEMIGAKKSNPFIYSLIRELRQMVSSGHISSENKFVGKTSNTLMKYVEEENAVSICGSLIGIKDKKKKAIAIEDLFSNTKNILFTENLYGVLLPRDEILKRNYLNWFVALKEIDVLKAENNITKILKNVLFKQPKKSKEIKSIAQL
jgi:hypothetical protein